MPSFKLCATNVDLTPTYTPFQTVPLAAKPVDVLFKWQYDNLTSYKLLFIYIFTFLLILTMAQRNDGIGSII